MTPKSYKNGVGIFSVLGFWRVRIQIAPQWPPKWPPVGWECVPRTTSARIPTQHPETSAEAHTELARAEFPVMGGAAMTRRRRLQLKIDAKGQP